MPSGDGTLNWPRYIARSRDGSTTYLSDVDNHRIVSVTYNHSVGLPALCGAAVVSVDTVVADVEPSSLQLTADDHLAFIDLSTRRLLYIDLAQPSAPPVQGPIVSATTGTFSLAPFGHLYYIDSEQELHRLGCRVTNNADNILGQAVGAHANHTHASMQAPVLNTSKIESTNLGHVRIESVALSIRAAIIGIAAFVIAMLFIVIHRWYEKDQRYHSLAPNMRSQQRQCRRREESDGVFGQQRLSEEENDDDDDDDDDDDSDPTDETNARLQSNRAGLQTVFDVDVMNLLDCDSSYYLPRL